MQIEKREHSVCVSCGQHYRVECFDNGCWHIQTDSLDGEFKADLWHRAYGYPLWYGREKPSYLTQHSVTYGYNWSGDVEGEFTYQGKKVKVRGTGQRERYVAVDSSSAELGGWEDWGYITFNEIHASMYDMRLGMKDFAVYDLENDRYYPEGKMTIEHEDWAFLRELDGFIPTWYNIRIEVEEGVYEVRAHVCNARTWGKLTGGRGTMSIRQWHAYPNILPRELYSDEAKTGEKFETL